MVINVRIFCSARKERFKRGSCIDIHVKLIAAQSMFFHLQNRRNALCRVWLSVIKQVQRIPACLLIKPYTHLLLVNGTLKHHHYRWIDPYTILECRLKQIGMCLRWKISYVVLYDGNIYLVLLQRLHQLHIVLLGRVLRFTIVQQIKKAPYHFTSLTEVATSLFDCYVSTLSKSSPFETYGARLRE